MLILRVSAGTHEQLGRSTEDPRYTACLSSDFNTRNDLLLIRRNNHIPRLALNVIYHLAG